MTASSQGLHPRNDQSKSYVSARGARGLAASIVFTSLATIFVLARLYTRTKLIKRIEANDWMIIIALILSYVFMAFFVVEALNGIGMHYVDIPSDIYINQMKAFWVTIPFYNAALLCAKASILMQYFRIFPSRRMRHACWVMLAILATYGTWAVLSAFLNCVPVAKFWDPSVPGSCLSSTGLWFSNAGMHIATDLAILVIPIPALAKLELPKKQRVALILIFAMGGFVCITSICRLVSLKKISDSSDPTYDNVAAAAWSAVECNVGIICACLPTLRPLVARIIPQLLSLKSDRHARRGNSRSNTKYKSKSKSDIHPASSYWDLPGGVGVSTTITTHVDEIEDRIYDGTNGDRFTGSKYKCGYAFGVPLVAGLASTQARVYVGSEQGDQNAARTSDEKIKAERIKERDFCGNKDGDVIVKTEVRTGSSSSAPLVDERQSHDR
ncbi:hypothetical protein BDV18DRAFT_148918 [Aspergillus unguis]